MQVPKPSGGDERMQGIANVRVGNYAGQEHFGANQARQNAQLAGAVGGVGDALFNEASKRQQRYNESRAIDLNNQMRLGFEEAKKDLFAKMGRDAANTPELVERWFDDFRTTHQGQLENQAQQDMFGKSLQAFRTNALTRAVEYRDQQELVYERDTSMAQMDLAGREAAEAVVGEGGIEAVLGKPGIGSTYLKVIERNIDKLTEGQPPEVRKLAWQDAVQGFHIQQVRALVATNPDRALEYLHNDRVKTAFPTAEHAKLHSTVYKAIEEDGKKILENNARRLGIKLGESCNDELEIEQALYEYDADIADKALTHGKRILAARQAREKKGLANQEDQAVRETATDIAASAQHEADVIEATDSLDGVTEAYREKVRNAAISRMKARRTRETVEVTNDALKVMADSDWDPVAISNEWPWDIQNKMAELATKKQKQLAKADPVKALEYCDMDREALRNLIMDGQWADITIALGGDKSPEYKLIWNKVFKPGQGSGFSELLTPLQYARNEFHAITKIDPGIKKGKEAYGQFLRLYEPMLRERARELGLDDVSKIPREEQEKVITHLLEEGDYDEGIWYWGRTKQRYQVLSDSNKDIQYFTPNGSSANPAGAAEGPEIPEFAKNIIGLRDKERRLLPNGGYLVVNQFGRTIIIYPDGRRFEADPVTPPARSMDEAYADTMDEAYSQLGDLPIL